MCLEFSAVENPVLKQVYDFYSFNVIPPVGKLVAGAQEGVGLHSDPATGDAQPYQYLVESIRKFHDQETLASLMRKAGFQGVTYTNLTGGIVAIHSGFRMTA